jgi:uncharacterized membrane protein
MRRMSYYEILLFLHIAAAILWLGAGFALQLLGLRADRERDVGALKYIADQASWLSLRFFVPVSLAVLVLGILLTIDGPWSFGDLWIVLGLVGYAATFATGLFVIKPATEKLTAIMERDRGMSPAAADQVRNIFLKSRIDLAVLFVVVADMALKPTGDDVAALVAMAVVIAAVTAYSVYRSRSAPAAEPAPGSP